MLSKYDVIFILKIVCKILSLRNNFCICKSLNFDITNIFLDTDSLCMKNSVYRCK